MTRAKPPLPLDDHLCFALYGASMAIGRLYKPILDEWGITYPQYLTLSVLWEEDGQRVGDLAARLDLEPSTMTPLVTRLASAGFVTRERDTVDARQVIVRLTEAGRALADRSRCLGEALVASAGLPLDRLREMTADARRLRDAVSGRGGDAAAPNDG
ncbi:MarR family winged helix-turn-helix transcriptional regulator [Aureimonas phyllosphaerae]|uniref:DNA-binding MarR family transcriptional regulator n=1 Tax=Aureimonas phyllosphaerae TaxID=1166078 RepID=A0A7W6BT21_9HYPH|nr:MarR family transcriptional regulator [Aureimonas phyllosphaerae]MBB3937491.1 DNA-binding MarR family transcriptional regulator [Aureimonas phyllosphaerae]MBB3961443.1 DNA-binding MarR family transcriptional regulator [Aureimonas phyllosphaerae]SFF38225.1 DNA-binding transcriptional regulator, MarR family [Aureimonas phyllosphaerae]